MSDIRKLVLTVKNLMPHCRNGWVSWRKVAKEQEGSEEFDVKLSALAQLDEWKHLFAVANNGRVVKLSEDGIRFAQAQQIEELTEVQQIADGVRRYAARLDRIRLNVEHISSVAHVGRKFVQAVYVDLVEEIIPSETPVEFRPHDGGSLTHGKVVGQEPDGGVLYVSFDNEIFESSLPAGLSIDRGFLLYQLAERIRSLPHLPPFIEPILHNKDSLAVSVAGQDSVEVAEGLAHLPTPWTRFLWGPPGAGKTFALGHLITRLIQTEPEGQILIVAPSNRAVDVAVEQLVGQLENSAIRQIVEQRKILRFGYPRKPQIIERPELLGPPQLDELNKQVKSLSGRITKAEREKSSSADIAVLRAELLAAQEEVKNAVVAHIQHSQVVATTVTLAYLSSSPIPNHVWSTVLVDEVTMVTPAMCTFLASLAKKRLLLAGDPRQLGPVYENNSRASAKDFEWMGRDIFDKSGVSSGEGERRRIMANDARLARITSQRRCAPEIWSRVEHLYPEVRNLADEKHLQKLIELPPCAGRAIALLDTSESGGVAFCQKMHHSWQNQFTADLAMEVACTIASEAAHKISIAIISPYRAQVRLLRKWIRQEQRADRTPYNAIDFESGTVHQFQGSDADVVIFDMVDGFGRSGIGYLLRGDTGIRLVNVAITRAKGKLVVLANKTWCGRAFERTDNPILWDLIMGRGPTERLQVLPPAHIDTEKQREKPESPIEQTLLEAMLKHTDLSSVVTQYVIRDKTGSPISRADFAFPALKYAVYCDGKQWHLREDRWQRDWRQRNKLAELGWIFSVFTGSDIYRNPDECTGQIAETYRSRLESTGIPGTVHSN